MDATQSKFEGYAVVEIFGHIKEVGFVTTEYFGAAALFRIDTPELPMREYNARAPGVARGRDAADRLGRPARGVPWKDAPCRAQRDFLTHAH
jgi:hypothetical protein